MVRVRSRFSTRHVSADEIRIQTSSRRRITFAVIAGVLVTAFLVGVNWDTDFQDGFVSGSIFYFLLTAFCIVVAGWSSSITIDRHGRRLVFAGTVFGLPLSSRVHELTGTLLVVLQAVRLLRDSEQSSRTAPGTSRFGSYLARRNVYYKLYLESGDKKEFIEDSTDYEEIEAVATTIAGFLNIGIRKEDI